MRTGNLNILGTVVGLTFAEITGALGYTPSMRAPSPTAGDIATVDVNGNVTDSGKIFDTDGTMTADSDNNIPTQAAIVTYVTSQGYLTSGTGVSSFNTRHGAVTLLSSDVTTALGYTPSHQASSPTAGDIATVDGSGNVTDSGKIFDTDGTMAANSDNHIPTQKALVTYVNSTLTALQALSYKGTLDLSSNPNYPAATVGDTYVVSVAGKIGGASGVSLVAGDLIICKVTNAGGTQAAVGADFDTVQTSLVGIVTGPSSSTDSDFAMFSGTAGNVVKDTGLSLSTDTTFSANSDSLIPSQKAIAAYLASFNYLQSITSSMVTTALGYTPVPNSTTINGQPLTSNITITAASVGLGNVLNAAQVKASQLVRGTFINTNLVSGQLTVTHNLALSAPYTVICSVFDNTGNEIIPDAVIGSTNSVVIDISSYGAITGTWGYLILG